MTLDSAGRGRKHRSAGAVPTGGVLEDAGQLHELVHIAARKAGTTSALEPILLADQASSTIPAAMEVAAQAP
jgi:hypothetical protein